MEGKMIRVAICDDQELYRDQIREILQSHFAEQSLQLFIYETLEALEQARTIADFDVFILDVEMQEHRNGIDYGIELREQNQQAIIIFITSHSEYALYGYDAYPLQYLVKPIDSGKLVQVFQYALEKLTKRVLFMKFTIDYLKESLNLYDIVYFERRSFRTIIHLVDESEYSVRESIKSIYTRMPVEDIFIRANQSILLNMDFIDRIEREEKTTSKKYSILLSNGQKHSLSRACYSAFIDNMSRRWI